MGFLKQISWEKCGKEHSSYSQITGEIHEASHIFQNYVYMYMCISLC